MLLLILFSCLLVSVMTAPPLNEFQDFVSRLQKRIEFHKNPKAWSENNSDLDLDWETVRADPKWDPLIKAAHASMTCSNSQKPGSIFAVVRGNHTEFIHSFGFANVEKKRAFTDNTYLPIGSTTKAMTSALLSLYASQGKLQFTDKLSNLYPDWRQLDPLLQFETTLQDCVSMRTGLARCDLTWVTNASYHTPEQLLKVLGYVPVVSPLRTKFLYNNLGYAAAGFIGARLSGAPWEAEIQEHLFTPLGMTRTTPWIREAESDPDFAFPYSDTGSQSKPFHSYPQYTNDILQTVGPAGSVSASVTDMTTWLKCLLSGGKNLKGKQVLPEKEFKQTWNSQFVWPEEQFSFYGPSYPAGFMSQNYASGWLVSYYRGTLFLWHTGGTIGHSTFVSFMPEEQIGFFWFTNTDGAGTDGLPLAMMAMDIALGREPWIDEKTVCTFPCPWDPSCKHAPEKPKEEASYETRASCVPTLKDYVGTYYSPLLKTLTISLGPAGTSFILTLGNTKCVASVTDTIGNDLFAAACDADWIQHIVKRTVRFSRSFKGEIESVSVPGRDYGEMDVPEFIFTKNT